MIKGGPKIINDGLVLCLDAHDAKSYAGEPTTNLLGSNDNPLNGASGISLTKIETQADGWIKYSMSGTFTGGTYPYMSYIDGVSFTGGTAYTSRAMIKTNVENKFNYFGSNGINYVNQPKDAEGTSRSVATEENGLNVYTVSREGFIYTSTTTQVGYLFTNPINNTTFNSSTDFMWIKNVQVEQKTYPTPYTYTSRSATNGWVDRTGNSTGGTLTNMDGTGTSHYRDGEVIMPVSASYLRFDGTNDEVIFSQNSAINLSANSPYTIEYWVSFNYLPTTSFAATVMKGSFTSSYGHLFIKNTSDANTQILVYTDDDSSPELTVNYLISTATWYHIVQTFSSGVAKLYINGELEGSASGLTSTSNTSALRLGSHAGSNYFMNGDLAKVNIYNIALTDAQVLSNYNATKERF